MSVENTLPPPTIQLPQPIPQVPSLLDTPQSAGRLHFFMAVLILLLAFFLASTPNRTSDVWLHMATGRALIDGQYHFGSDPFTVVEGESPWVNHTWLYDVVLYFLYSLIGGTGLMVLKAVLVMLLAVQLLRCSWCGKTLWISAAASALAVLALGPWLSLRPILLSLLFLVSTVRFLEKTDATQATLTQYWPILLMFTFWANLDTWFFLGPLCVACYFLGQLLPGTADTPPRAAGKKRPAIAVLGLVLVTGLGVCLINPHTVRIFQVPPQFGSMLLDQLRQDSSLSDPLLYPSWAIYFSTALFHQPAGLAFWALVSVGLLSFWLNFATRPWGRMFTWLAFFLPCLFRSQFVPFFAVVGGPILALNLQEFVRRKAPKRTQVTWLALARASLILGGLGLVVAAWPGWLVTGTEGPRRWVLEIDPSVQMVGTQIANWRQEGVLQGNGFHYFPETANALTWLFPDQKGFLNSHLHLSSESAADFVTIRKGFRTPGIPAKDSSWKALLRKHQISYLVIDGKDPRLTKQIMDNLLAVPQEWSLVFLGGRMAVFAWRDPENPGTASPLARHPINLESLAFGERDNQRAPDSGPDRGPEPWKWWDGFWRSRQVASMDRDLASLYLQYFDSMILPFSERHMHVWNFTLATKIVAAGASVGAPSLEECFHVDSRPREMARHAFLNGLDDGPTASLHLAIRAARRALKFNPDDGQVHFLLGEAYYRLQNHSRERIWAVKFPKLARIRTVQVISSYQQALHFKRDLVQAHNRLSELYLTLGYKDLAYQHSLEVLKHERLGPVSGEPREKYRQRLAQLKEFVQIQEQELRELEEKYLFNSSNLKVLDRAFVAGRMGLAGKALEILLKSDIAAFGPEGMDVELKMLLGTGQVEKVRAWMTAAHELDLGPSSFHWTKAQLAAAVGDYFLADEHLHALVKSPASPAMPMRTMGTLMLANAILDNDGLFQRLPLRVFPLTSYGFLADRQTAPARLWGLANLFNEEAKIQVLRAILALECGRTREAKDLFQNAIDFWNCRLGRTFVDDESAAGRRIAEFHLVLLNSDSRARSK